MHLPPVQVILDWPAPNYVDPICRGPAHKIVAGTLLCLVTTTLALRLYTRFNTSRGFGLDDLLITIAYVPAATFVFLGIVAETILHWDRHVWDIDSDLYEPSLRVEMAIQLVFDVATSLTKLSILATLYRLAEAASNRRMMRTVVMLSWLISLNCVVFMVVVVFQCRPVSDYWTISPHRQQCINEAAHLLAAGLINTTTDFVVVLLPMPLVYRLKLPKRQRMTVMALFGAGLLACGAGIARTYYTWHMTQPPLSDITWHTWPVLVSSEIELNVGILCASIPAMKPFFATHLPRVLGPVTRRRTRPSSHKLIEPNPAARTDGMHSFKTATVKLKSLRSTTSLSPPPPTLAKRSLTQQPADWSPSLHKSAGRPQHRACGLQETAHAKNGPCIELDEPVSPMYGSREPSPPSSWSSSQKDVELLASPGQRAAFRLSNSSTLWTSNSSVKLPPRHS